MRPVVVPCAPPLPPRPASLPAPPRLLSMLLSTTLRKDGEENALAFLLFALAPAARKIPPPREGIEFFLPSLF